MRDFFGKHKIAFVSLLTGVLIGASAILFVFLDPGKTQIIAVFKEAPIIRKKIPVYFGG